MHVALPGLDRLAELLQAEGRLDPCRAARAAFALEAVTPQCARVLLEPLVRSDTRLRWVGEQLALRERPDPLLAEAEVVVFDLETSGLPAGRAEIVEIGAVRVTGLVPGDCFEALLREGGGVPEAAVSTSEALAGFSAFAGQAPLVAHNARFDRSFLDAALGRRDGSRFAGVLLDTLALARELLRGRCERLSLAALHEFFGLAHEPCHRALPDARATAELFCRLVELASERGVQRLSELQELAAPARRQRT